MTLLAQKLLEFEEFLNSDHEQKLEGEWPYQCGWSKAIEAVQKKFEELIAETPVPNQVNLALNEELIGVLQAALDREQIALAQRTRTGYIGLRAKLHPLASQGLTLATFCPEEAVLLGLQMFGMAGLWCPDFLDQFGLKIAPGEEAVKS